MDDDVGNGAGGGRVGRFIRDRLRLAGRQFQEARRAYEEAKASTLVDLPTDEEGRARIVCRRYAERRAVRLDDRAHPECFDPEHLDCRGCVEDIHDERVETW